MARTITASESITWASGDTKPGRAKMSYEIVMDGETESDWANVTDFAVLNLAWFNNTAQTIQFEGRYSKPGGFTSPHLIGDKDGAPVSLDLSQGDASLGSSFPLDVAATVDQIRIKFPGANSDTFVISAAG